MDDTLEPNPRRADHGIGLPFVPAALMLAAFAGLAVWPREIPGLARAPRLVLLAALLAGTLAWIAGRRPGSRAATALPRPRPRAGRRATPRRPVMAAASRGDVAASEAWLQVMSGPDAVHLTRGVLEAAAAMIERGRRVLIVDGARRLKLHESIGREATPGLLECLAGERPLDAAIQGDGMLWFLPRGNPMRSEVWPHLGRLLQEARPHFDRILLALDFAVPRDAGLALQGLPAAGWWCDDGFASILPDALAERLGISLRSIKLPPPEEVTPERAGLHPALVAPVPLVATGGARRGRGVLHGLKPPVVDCDLQLWGRLRFLRWMHGVQAGGQRELEARP